MQIHNDIGNYDCCCHSVRETADVVLGGMAIITIVKHQLRSPIWPIEATMTKTLACLEARERSGGER